MLEYADEQIRFFFFRTNLGMMLTRGYKHSNV